MNDAVRRQLDELVRGLGSILGDRLEGVYVHGSLALGCFNARHSDLDVIAIVKDATTPGERARLARLLAAPAERPLELHLLRRDDLEPWRHPAPFELHWAGRLVERSAEGDPDLAAHVVVARAAGIALLGPPAPAVFPEVPWADYEDALRRDLTWTRAHARELYAALSPLRVWATLETKELHSKASGAEWALPRLPPDLRPFAERALAAYTAGGSFQQDEDELEWLLAFVETRVAT